MATKYWRNLTPFTWSSTACWSNDSPSGTAGAAIPVIGDDVVISNVGQAAGTINITATATAVLGSLTCIGAGWTITGSMAVNLAGTLDLSNSVTWTNTGTLSLQGTGGSYDITTAGTSFGCDITFGSNNVAGSSFNLLSALTLTALRITTFTSGTIILNNFTLTTGTFISNTTNTRGITFGTGFISLIYSSAATVVYSVNGTNLTSSGTGGFTSAMTVTRTFNYGGVTADQGGIKLFLTSGSSVPTITGWWNKIDFTGTSITMGAVTLSVSSITLSTSGTYTSMTIASLGAGTLTTNGMTIGNFTINHTGTTTLSSAITTTTTGLTTLTQGTLDVNGFTLSAGQFSSSNSNTRAIIFGTTNIVLMQSTVGTSCLTMAIAGGFTYTGTGGFSISDQSNTRTMAFGSTSGGSTSNAPNVTFTTGSSACQIITGSWFKTLNFGSTAYTHGATTVNVSSLTLSASGTYTQLTVNAVDTGTITANGTTGLNPLTINHTGTTTLGAALIISNVSGQPGTTTLTQGTLNLNGFTLTTCIFSSNNSNTRAITFGSANIDLSAPVAQTAGTTVLSMSTLTGFTRTGTGGFTVANIAATKTFTCGQTDGTTSNAPSLTFTTGASIATISTGGFFNKLDFGSTSFNPGTTALNLNSLTLSGSGTYTALTVTMVGTGTITPNGKTIAPFTVNHAGTTTLAAALSCTTYTQTAGTVNFATFNLTCSGAASYTAGTLSNIGTISCTSWTVTGTFTLTQGTITPSTSFVLTSGAFNYNGGTLSAVPTFTHTAGTVTLGQSYALTTTGTYTQTAGTLALAGFTLTTGIFSSNNANTRAITFGTGNIVLSHTTAATVVLSMATTTGFTYTGTGGFTVAAMSNTRTFTFGSTAGGTTSNAPRLTFTTGASVATLTTASWFNTLDFGTTSFNPGTTALNINGLTLSSSGTYTALTATMVGTGTITSNGKTIAALTVNSAGTATLAAALTMSGALTLTQGTLACGVYNVQSDTFASTGVATRSMTGSGTYTVAGSGATAFSNASAAGITITGLIISMTNASAKTFAGGGGTYPTLNQGGAGALTISGDNSFADLTATTRPSTITFTISTTQTFTAFTLSGTAGNLVTINSSTASTQATVSKSSGTVSVDYVSIIDSNAAGGASWYAGANSTNVSNNTGWIFTAPPTATATGNFFLFF